MLNFHKLTDSARDSLDVFKESLASIPEVAIKVYFEDLEVQYLQSLQGWEEADLTMKVKEVKMIVEIRERLLVSRREALQKRNQENK